jgi:hypothetical protein
MKLKTISDHKHYKIPAFAGMTIIDKLANGL